ncbi:MAG: sigma-70 family RNA polymerase sigma factor [Planctomycetota bacterium]
MSEDLHSEEALDDELVRGLARGDEEAVARLLDRFWAPAYRVAYGVVSDPGAAEDVAQEAVVRALQAIEGFERGRAFRPWFLRIVVNVARNHQRADARRSQHEERGARPERTATPDALERQEQAALVRDALGGLAPKLREALALRYLEELSLGEVARVLGCPEGTVSSRVRRGMARLRAGLQALQPEQGRAGAAPAIGAVAGLLLIQKASAAPAALAAADALARAAALPPLALDPALAPELADAAPTPDPDADALDDLLDAAGEGLANAAPPPPPPPSELLDLAQSAAGAAPDAARSVAPALLLLLLFLLLAGGSAALLAPDPARSAPQVALVSPNAGPAPAGGRPLGAPAAVTAPTLELLVPAALTVGDVVDAAAFVRWGEGDPASLEVSLGAVQGLAVERGAPRAVAGGVRWPLRLRATRPGSGRLAIRAQGAGHDLRASASLAISAPDRRVRLVHNVELFGPEGTARLALDPRAAGLGAPRRLLLRVIPGLAAEAALSLQGFAHQPTGCFEQTTAATFPGALVLALARGRRDDDAVSPSLVAEARRYALEGARRLRRFQGPGGGFSLHPGEPEDPWLTAVGLSELVRLLEVLPAREDELDAQGRPQGVDPRRAARAARALARWQQSDGSFPSGRFVGARWGRGELAVSAYAAIGLSEYLALPVAAEDREARVAAERAQAFLEGSVRPQSLPLELALVGRAFLAAKRQERAVQVAEWLEARARREEGAGAEGEVVHWEGGPNPTGTPNRVASVEATAVAVQVLVGAERRELVPGALRWLARQREGDGFGGTQATVQTLEAFRAAGWRRASGRLVASAGGCEHTLDLQPPGQEERAAALAAAQGQALAADAPATPVEGGDLAGEPSEARRGIVPLGARSERSERSALEVALGAPEERDVEAFFAQALQRGLTLRFAGEGDLRLQVIAEGQVAWDAGGFDGPGRAAGQLEVSVERPLSGRVGVVQEWRLKLRNRGAAPLVSPMVELRLPPGFALAEGAGGDAEGGLVRAMGRGPQPPLIAGAPASPPPPVRFYERVGPLLVLYLRDLAPGEPLALPLRLVPTLAGSFAGGALEAYAYYAASDGKVLAAPLRFVVEPALEVGALPRPVAPPRPRPSPAASPRPRPSASPSPSPSPEDAPGPRTIVIGWDLALGPLDATKLDLPRGDGPLERLLGRALCSAPTGKTATSSGLALVHFARQSWTNGFPLTVDDYLASLRASALEVARGQAPLWDARDWELLPLPYQVVDNYTLSVQHPRRECDSPLFFPGPPRDSERAETSGPYALRPGRDGSLLLVPRLGTPGPPVRIDPVRDPRAAVDRCDLIWRAPSEATGADLQVALFGERQRNTLVRAARLPRACCPSALGGRRRVAGGDEEVEARLPRVLTLTWGQAALEQPAAALAERLRAQGFDVELTAASLGSPRGAVLLLAATDSHVSGFLHAQALATLALYAGNAVPGRLDPRRSLDSSGYLRYPPQLEHPPVNRRQRQAWEEGRAKLMR